MGLGRVRIFALGSLLLVSLLFAGEVALAPSETAAVTFKKTYLPLVFTPVKARFGYGMNLSHPDNSPLVRDMGFGWVKYQLKWSVSEPRQGHFDWTDADLYPWDSYAWNYVKDTAPGLKILLRIDTPPEWANGTGDDNTPPRDLATFETFMYEVSRYLKGKVAAYEIWNEPNLSREWGGRSPDPAGYARLLRAGYDGVKRGDPDALVVSAGMATTITVSGAMNDLDFIRGMYDSGARPYFDVLGSHPYGFGNPPDAMDASGVNFFRRAEKQRELMVKYGDSNKQVWATEFGWLINPADLGIRSCGWDWKMKTPEEQADYLQGAYEYAYTHWDWMGVMLTFNLDFSDKRDYWRTECDTMRWYAVMSGYYDQTRDVYYLTPRLAYDALKAMAKPTER